MQELLGMMDDQYVIGISHGVHDGNGKIKITGGPLANLQGRIVKVDTRQRRAVVRLSLMGQPQTVSVALKTSNPAEPEAE